MHYEAIFNLPDIRLVLSAPRPVLINALAIDFKLISKLIPDFGI